MPSKRIAIIGTGVSGLSLGWYLKNSDPSLDIVFFEKNARAGGWIDTDHTTGFHFEKGPRAFKADRSPATLSLISDLGMTQDVIWSQAKPQQRYLWHNEELQRFPTNLLAFLCSPLTRGFIKAMVSEWRQPKKIGDETVWEFVLRRFNYDVARRFFDPLVVGIFGGDIRKISMRACFPQLKEWEEKYGSVTHGFFRSLWEKRGTSPFCPHIPKMPKNAIFSLRGGLDSLCQSLVEKVKAPIFYSEGVHQLERTAGGVRVHTDNQQMDVDFVVLATPAHATGELLQEHCKEVCQELLRIYSQSIAVVSLGYDEHTLPVEGFGYLTSTYANEDVLGVVFDSSVFPEHNRQSQETRLTVKIEAKGLSDDEYVQIALRGVRRHLGISRMPKEVHCKQTMHAIPQYSVGHLDRMRDLEAKLYRAFPECALVGNYLCGVGVDACVAKSRDVAAKLIAACDTM